MSLISLVERARATSFRARLLGAMMVAISGVTLLGLSLAQRRMSLSAEQEIRREFQTSLAHVQAAEEVRHAILAERCRALVRRPRIHAALEDDALDLLYPSARDELPDLVAGDAPAPTPDEHELYALHGRFYRFLDAHGQVIAALHPEQTGALAEALEKSLSLPEVPLRQQAGFFERREEGAGPAIDEVITTPIFSSESGDPIAALVVGFTTLDNPPSGAIRTGLQTGHTLLMPGLAPAENSALAAQLTAASLQPRQPGKPREVLLAGRPCLLLTRLLNPGSLYPPAQEITLYGLSEARARQRQVRLEILSAGAMLLLSGFAASHFLSDRLSRPVQKLETISAENLAHRSRAEAELETKSEELQRAARFSADASHQLKTPVTVLRAGLEELLATEPFTPALREEISALVHQTYRLSHIVEDLLLLSRMEAGRVRLSFSPVNLHNLAEAWLDDLSALPGGADLAVQCEMPPGLVIAGEKRYTSMILQNLLENARKYNCPAGRIAISVLEEEETVVLRIGNTGRPIAEAAREHIFERFHRGAIGENVPGHGLGLNLARELARLHGGDLWLAGSEENWTEFRVRFRLARKNERGYAGT